MSAPRVVCPACGRSIATTGDTTGARWARTHNRRPGERCIGSRRDARTWPAPGDDDDEGFVSDPMLDGLDTLLTVDVRSGRVHRGLCDRLPAAGYGAKWSHAVSGEQDRACALCLPGGLPE